MLTEDCEGEVEITDLLPFSPVADLAFSQLAMERGVVGVVNGGEEELAAHTFTTPHIITLVIQNKVLKGISCKL